MSLTFGLNTWSLWRHGEGQAEFRAGLPGAAPQVPWASVLVRWPRLPWSDQAPLLPSSGQSVVPEPKDEVEAREGGSPHFPPWAGPRGWGLCRLSKFRVTYGVVKLASQENNSPKSSKCKAFVAQSCLSLCDPRDCSLPGSSVHGILQARILEWVTIPFSRGSSDPGIKPRSSALQVESLPSEPPGKPSKCKDYPLFSYMQRCKI